MEDHARHVGTSSQPPAGTLLRLQVCGSGRERSVCTQFIYGSGPVTSPLLPLLPRAAGRGVPSFGFSDYNLHPRCVLPTTSPGEEAFQMGKLDPGRGDRPHSWAQMGVLQAACLRWRR